MSTYSTRSGVIEEIPRLDKDKKYVLDENMKVGLAKSSNIITARQFYKNLGFKILTSVTDVILLENAIKHKLTIITSDKGLCWLASKSGVEIIYYDHITKKFYLNLPNKTSKEST